MRLPERNTTRRLLNGPGKRQALRSDPFPALKRHFLSDARRSCFLSRASPSLSLSLFLSLSLVVLPSIELQITPAINEEACTILKRARRRISAATLDRCSIHKETQPPSFPMRFVLRIHDFFRGSTMAVRVLKSVHRRCTGASLRADCPSSARHAEGSHGKWKCTIVP